MKYFDNGSEIVVINKKNYTPPKNWEEKTEEDFLSAQKEKEIIMEIQTKKAECRETILARYSETDQANLAQDALGIIGSILMHPRQPTAEEAKTLAEAKKAREFRDEVLKEFKTKGVDADFSKFQ